MQQCTNFTGKSSNDNGNIDNNHEKNGKFDGDIFKLEKGKGKRDELEKNHARHNDQKE